MQILNILYLNCCSIDSDIGNNKVTIFNVLEIKSINYYQQVFLSTKELILPKLAYVDA